MRPHRLIMLAAALMLAGCGGSGGNDARDLYSYDSAQPLRLQNRRLVNPKYAVKVREISFAGPEGRVPGYLIVPPGKGPYPAVIYFHGAGQNAASMLLQATWLAGRRVVALSVTSPYSRIEGQGVPEGLPGLRRDRELTIQSIQELRRGVDLLQSLPQVDDERIGFVGYSAGARFGAILAGVERRIRAFVFMSGGIAPVEEFVRLAPEEDRDEVRDLIKDINALEFIADAAPAKLYFQYGLRDEIVPQEGLARLYETASEPKELKTYDAGHELSEGAHVDQLAWLTKTLEVKGPPVPGALTGPTG